jgi:hypothetical protein
LTTRSTHTAGFATVLLTLCACASPPRPKPPATPQILLPTATVKIMPIPVGSNRDYGLVERSEFDCSVTGRIVAKRPATLARYDYQPHKRVHSDVPLEITLPAGISHFYVAWSTRQGNYTCEIPFSASLDAGHRYTLKASSVDWSSRSTGKCRLELVDAATGAQSPLVMRLTEKASEEFICKK